MKYFLIILTAIFLFSCGQKAKQQLQQDRLKELKDSIAKLEKEEKLLKQFVEPDWYFETKYEISLPKSNACDLKNLYNNNYMLGMEFGPEKFNDFYRKVDLNYVSSKNIESPKPFKAIEALQKVIPGDVFTLVGDDTEQRTKAISWNCPTCKTKTKNYFGMEDMSTEFPNKKGNSTIISGEYDLKIQDNTYKLITFFTTDEKFVSFTGRFAGAKIGAALFQENATSYTLKNFEPFIGEYGTYSQPVEPDIYFSDSIPLMLMYSTCNGGPGEAYTEILEIAQRKENGFEIVFEEGFLKLTNTHWGEWNTRTSIHAIGNNLIEIELITKGYFIGMQGKILEYYEYELLKSPKEFMKVALEADKNKAPFEFSMKRVFRLKGNQYALYKFDFEHKPLKGEWKQRE